MKMRHILETQQFSCESIMELIKLGKKMKSIVENGGANYLNGKIMAVWFYEPSSRTRGSFEVSMLRLGGQYIATENAEEFSSAAKEETLEDSIRTIGNYVDVIVLRHYESGSAKRAAAVSSVPIINAGDGPGQHPTQALLDAFTIESNIGRLDNLTISMVGDLANGRTVRSLVYLLSKFPNNRFIFVAPDVVSMRDDIKQHLDKHNIEYKEIAYLQQAAQEADVLYVTRIQKERFGDNMEAYESASGKYVVSNDIANMMSKDSIIMHPLPRVDELLSEVDNNHRAVYFKNQIKNGVYVRMALLTQLLA